MTEMQFVTVLVAIVGAAVVYTLWRGRRQSVVFEKVDLMAAQVEELTLRVVALELEKSGYRLWSAQLRGQVYELGGEPVPPPSWLVVPGAATRAEGESSPGDIIVEVYHLVSRLFNDEELDDLALRAGIEPGSFGGDTQNGRARELVEVAVRHGRFVELVDTARRLRPHVNWPRVTAGFNSGE